MTQGWMLTDLVVRIQKLEELCKRITDDVNTLAHDVEVRLTALERRSGASDD